MTATDTVGQPRSRITHELKIWPEFFSQVRGGRMKFQLRRNDRDYLVGDELVLKEFAPPGRELQAADKKTAPFKVGENGLYSGRELLVRVDYLMLEPEVDKLTCHAHFPGYVIMSISLIP